MDPKNKHILQKLSHCITQLQRPEITDAERVLLTRTAQEIENTSFPVLAACAANWRSAPTNVSHYCLLAVARQSSIGWDRIPGPLRLVLRNSAAQILAAADTPQSGGDAVSTGQPAIPRYLASAAERLLVDIARQEWPHEFPGFLKGVCSRLALPAVAPVYRSLRILESVFQEFGRGSNQSSAEGAPSLSTPQASMSAAGVAWKRLPIARRLQLRDAVRESVGPVGRSIGLLLQKCARGEFGDGSPIIMGRALMTLAATVRAMGPTKTVPAPVLAVVCQMHARGIRAARNSFDAGAPIEAVEEAFEAADDEIGAGAADCLLAFIEGCTDSLGLHVVAAGKERGATPRLTRVSVLGPSTIELLGRIAEHLTDCAQCIVRTRPNSARTAISLSSAIGDNWIDSFYEAMQALLSRFSEQVLLRSGSEKVAALLSSLAQLTIRSTTLEELNPLLLCWTGVLEYVPSSAHGIVAQLAVSLVARFIISKENAVMTNLFNRQTRFDMTQTEQRLRDGNRVTQLLKLMRGTSVDDIVAEQRRQLLLDEARATIPGPLYNFQRTLLAFYRSLFAVVPASRMPLVKNCLLLVSKIPMEDFCRFSAQVWSIANLWQIVSLARIENKDHQQFAVKYLENWVSQLPRDGLLSLDVLIGFRACVEAIRMSGFCDTRALQSAFGIIHVRTSIPVSIKLEVYYLLIKNFALLPTPILRKMCRSITTEQNFVLRTKLIRELAHVIDITEEMRYSIAEYCQQIPILLQLRISTSVGYRAIVCNSFQIRHVGIVLHILSGVQYRSLASLVQLMLTKVPIYIDYVSKNTEVDGIFSDGMCISVALLIEALITQKLILPRLRSSISRILELSVRRHLSRSSVWVTKCAATYFEKIGGDIPEQIQEVLKSILS